MIDLCESESRDSLFDGELICYQHKTGYRFSVDSVILAHFIGIKSNDRVLDLGSGSSVISMILLYRWSDMVEEVSGLEIQQGLADLARKNYLSNNFQQLGSVIHGDVKNVSELIKPESYDRIVCNPPFYPPASGRINKDTEARLARHQILATLQDFLKAAAYAVKNGGTVSFIYPAEQSCHFVSLAQKFRLEVKKIQFVYSYPDKITAARLVLVECFKNGGPGTEILPPFYIYAEKNGAFSVEMQDFYRKNQELSSNINSPSLSSPCLQK